MRNWPPYEGYQTVAVLELLYRGAESRPVRAQIRGPATVGSVKLAGSF
jgi:hypothetical protein